MPQYTCTQRMRTKILYMGHEIYYPFQTGTFALRLPYLERRFWLPRDAEQGSTISNEI